jgi:hypothetical protein
MHKVNLGYAFINFRMGFVAMQLHYSLQGWGWNMYDSHKHIDIVPSNIQV